MAEGGDPADHLLRVALTHPEVIDGRVDRSTRPPCIRLTVRVVMPLAMEADGCSDTGVRTVEEVAFAIPDGFPWSAPIPHLRPDFPRKLPHLMPASEGRPPRPCLVDGDHDEFFAQFGLVEYGIWHLVEQLAVWLRKAALNVLNDPDHGWEPMLRTTLRDIVEFDADAARALVGRSEGWLAWGAQFHRLGSMEARLNQDALAWLSSAGERTPLVVSDKGGPFDVAAATPSLLVGKTAIGVIWADKLPSGAPRVVDEYWPEDVTCLADLRARAADLGCGRGLDTFLNSLERAFREWHVRCPVPVGIVLCVRRPFNLIGSSSPIELLPYVVELRADAQRASIFSSGGDEPVSPAMHLQTLTADLLREMSGTPERPPMALLGCGSVGSKMAMHAARSGQTVVALSDNGHLRPHNLARHALGAGHLKRPKAEGLAAELKGLQSEPTVFTGDLTVGLLDQASSAEILPRGATVALNATASLSVREAFAAAARTRPKLRCFEAGLFGRGRVGYLLEAGKGNNPSHSDLMAAFYARIADAETRELVFGSGERLAPLQIGQGCGSLTMAMDDARLSMMAAALSIEMARALDEPVGLGSIVVGRTASDTASTEWTSHRVPPFETVDIDGSGGWVLRLSSDVAERIRREAAHYGSVETGGLMIGTSSARLREVTVVDLLPAPPDSSRSASLFVLGKQGLKEAILRRHGDSGGSLFDVGTWHSHLSEMGPSTLDRRTAADLAAERAPPSVLLITTPTRFHALMATG